MISTKQLSEINTVVGIYNNVVKAINNTNSRLMGIEAGISKSAKIPGIDEGEVYYCVLSSHSDGSGGKVDMGGCYVGVAVTQATLTVLLEKKAYIEHWLLERGIGVTDQDDEEGVELV